MVNGEVPVFESVSVRAALPVPTCWLENAKGVGDKVAVVAKRILVMKESESAPPYTA